MNSAALLRGDYKCTPASSEACSYATMTVCAYLEIDVFEDMDLLVGFLQSFYLNGLVNRRVGQPLARRRSLRRLMAQKRRSSIG